MSALPTRVNPLLAAIAAAAVSLALYAPSFGGPFISDDVLYLEHNAPLSAPLGKAIAAVVSPSHFVVGNWSPVHQLFLLAEWRLFGDAPLPYRVTNALLHAACALALAAALRRSGASARVAWAGAALFLFHPVAAEPVGWINQSKTLLCLGFGLLALERWLAWLEAPSRGRTLAFTGLGALAVLAKPAAIPLIGVLAVAGLVRRERPGRIAADLLPLAIVTGLALWLGVAAQAAQGGTAPWFGGSPAATARVVPGLLWRYVRLAFLPVDLVHGVHPVEIDAWLDPGVVGPIAGLVALGIATAVACLRAPRRAIWAAWFVLWLLPVLQLVPMINLFADRYLYAALPGALLLGVEGADALVRRLRLPGAAAGGALVLACAGLGALSWQRAQVWADPVALYTEAVEAYPNGRTGWTGLGAALHARGDLEGAADAYLHSLAVHPDDGHVRHLLGRVRLLQRRGRLALYDLEESLRLAPDHPDVHWTRRTAERLRSRGVVPKEDRLP